MTGRINPLGDLGDFQTKPKASKPERRRVAPEVIDQLARDNGFPSRQPLQAAPEPAQTTTVPGIRRYRTGRNVQKNIKATVETIDALNRKADDLGVPLGEVVRRGLIALEVLEKHGLTLDS
ncbi:hypothetical protein ACI2UY_22600 [Ralstonia nicotianae]